MNSQILVYAVFIISFMAKNRGRKLNQLSFCRETKEKKYHIDYIFTDAEKAQRTTEFKIHDFKDWIELSDHVPIEWNFSERSEGKLNGQR